MLASALLLTLAGLIPFSTAGYALQDDYSPSNFFSEFDFFTGSDPTNGYVNYLDQATAQQHGLISANGNSAYMGVDHTSIASGSGRSSVRLTSKKIYNHALVILDATHMPGGVCGAWPAFWTVGPSWPNNGEIDIIEGVNSQVADAMTLHTNGGCGITNTGRSAGQLTLPNCDVNAAGQAKNAGCQITTTNPLSYGNGFNGNGGGVYATEWTSDAISIWFFPRGAIPADITAGTPDPSSWGLATAQFAGACDIDAHFKNHQIVFDTTFCGDWAGAVWSGDAVCGKLAPTCQAYVQNNPQAFANAYWEVNSLRVYQANGAAPPPVAKSGNPAPSSAAPVASSAPVAPPQSLAPAPAPAPVPAPAPPAAPAPTSAAAAPPPPQVTKSPLAAPNSNGAVVVSTAAAAPATAAPAAAPATTSSSSQPEFITVSALQMDQFPSPEETQTRGIDRRRHLHRHVLGDKAGHF